MPKDQTSITSFSRVRKSVLTNQYCFSRSYRGELTSYSYIFTELVDTEKLRSTSTMGILYSELGGGVSYQLTSNLVHDGQPKKERVFASRKHAPFLFSGDRGSNDKAQRALAA